MRVFQTKQPRRILRDQLNRLLKTKRQKAHQVANSAIQSKHAAGQFAIQITAAAFYLNIKSAKLIFAVRHAGGADGISNQDCPIKSFGAKNKLDHCWINMQTVG